MSDAHDSIRCGFTVICYKQCVGLLDSHSIYSERKNKKKMSKKY